MSNKMGILPIFFLLFWVSFLFPGKSHCEFYKYVDKDGTLCFVDDMSKIPPEYRDNLITYQEKYDNLSLEERKMMREKEEKERKEEEKKGEEEENWERWPLKACNWGRI